MLSYFDLRNGTRFILDGQPYEVMEFTQMKKAQGLGVAQTKIRNLLTGKVLDRNFHQGDTFDEAQLDKVEVKFLYSHREQFFFCKVNNPADRFQLEESQIGVGSKFLKQNQIMNGFIFQGKVINIVLPIKVQLKVTEAPPGVQGGRAQAGTKVVVVETGANINAPLFIKEGDMIEINTETGDYVRRLE